MQSNTASRTSSSDPVGSRTALEYSHMVQPPLPLSRHANAVRVFVQQRQFTVMLDALETEAQRHGFIFERGGRAAAVSQESLVAFGAAALKAQMLFVSPGEPEETLVRYIKSLGSRNDALQCATQLLAALEASGIVIADSHKLLRSA